MNKSKQISYDEWKTINPADEELGTEPRDIEFTEQVNEIERLRAENQITISVCNQNTDLKRQLADLASSAALYLSLDGSDKIYDAVKLQGARVKLREEIQRAKEACK